MIGRHVDGMPSKLVSMTGSTSVVNSYRGRQGLVEDPAVAARSDTASTTSQQTSIASTRPEKQIASDKQSSSSGHKTAANQTSNTVDISNQDRLPKLVDKWIFHLI
jgi:hypothetical protein